jgi:hypothetical protein
VWTGRIYQVPFLFGSTSISAGLEALLVDFVIDVNHMTSLVRSTCLAYLVQTIRGVYMVLVLKVKVIPISVRG